MSYRQLAVSIISTFMLSLNLFCIYHSISLENTIADVFTFLYLTLHYLAVSNQRARPTLHICPTYLLWSWEWCATRACFTGFTTAQNLAIGQLTIIGQMCSNCTIHILHYTFRFYNCTNFYQLLVKICPVRFWSGSFACLLL